MATAIEKKAIEVDNKIKEYSLSKINISKKKQIVDINFGAKFDFRLTFHGREREKQRKVSDYKLIRTLIRFYNRGLTKEEISFIKEVGNDNSFLIEDEREGITPLVSFKPDQGRVTVITVIDHCNSVISSKHEEVTRKIEL